MVFNPKNIIIYQWLHDKYPDRTLDEKIKILKELNVDTIFRAFWYCPYCVKTNSGVNYVTDAEWDEMQDIVSKIKAQLPNIKIIAGFGPRVNKIELKNYTTGEIYNVNTPIIPYDMFIDPTKWGLSATKEQALSDNVSDISDNISDNVSDNVSDLSALSYFNDGDWTNPTYYQIALSRAKKYIDIGCDGIWIDLLYSSTKYLYNLANQDKNHLAVLDMYNAATNLVKDIRDYQISKGQEPLFGTWIHHVLTNGEPWFPENLPTIDFIVANRGNFSASEDFEVFNPINVDNYKTQRKWHVDIYGNDIVSLFFIDDPIVLTPFSQCLTIEQQKSKLREMKNVCDQSGFKIAYPVHGMYNVGQAEVDKGCPGITIKKSFGQYNYYDSKAPEFDTYPTIKELINPITTTTQSELGIGPILVLGLLAGGLYLYLKNKNKESYQYQ